MARRRRYEKSKTSKPWSPISPAEARFYETEWEPPKSKKKKASKKPKSAPTRTRSKPKPATAPAKMCRFVVYDEERGAHTKYDFTSKGYNDAFLRAQRLGAQVVVTCAGSSAFTVLDCKMGECFPFGGRPEREVPTQFIPGVQGARRRRRVRRRRKR